MAPESEKTGDFTVHGSTALDDAVACLIRFWRLFTPFATREICRSLQQWLASCHYHNQPGFTKHSWRGGNGSASWEATIVLCAVKPCI